jgi:hypothetical protein
MPEEKTFDIDLFDLAKELLACAVAAGPGHKREKLLKCVAMLQPDNDKTQGGAQDASSETRSETWPAATAPSSSSLH